MEMRVALILSLALTATTQPLLFPHGYFDSAKLRPRDAIFLNLMAQSNLEYGGVTMEVIYFINTLDKLDAIRKVVPRPPLTRSREEDDKQLDREPVVAPSDHGETGKALTTEKKGNPLKSPFRTVRLKQSKRSSSMEENPFEEIATRAPPRDFLQFQKLRESQRRRRRKKKRPSNRQYLTREDIVKPRGANESVGLPRSHKIASASLQPVEPDTEGAESEVQAPRASGVETSSAADPFGDEKPSNDKQEKGFVRLPNNPFRNVDISKPTVLTLPTPPKDVQEVSTSRMR